MIRSTAIAKKCLECSGDSFKEVTLCHIFDCPLWEYRFGNSLKSNPFHARMKRAKARHPKEIDEIIKIIKEDSNYIKNIPNKKIQAYVATFYGIKSKNT